MFNTFTEGFIKRTALNALNANIQSENANMLNKGFVRVFIYHRKI